MFSLLTMGIEMNFPSSGQIVIDNWKAAHFTLAFFGGFFLDDWLYLQSWGFVEIDEGSILDFFDKFDWGFS